MLEVGECTEVRDAPRQFVVVEEEILEAGECAQVRDAPRQALGSQLGLVTRFLSEARVTPSQDAMLSVFAQFRVPFPARYP